MVFYGAVISFGVPCGVVFCLVVLGYLLRWFPFVGVLQRRAPGARFFRLGGSRTLLIFRRG